MKILFSSYLFDPSVGGIETVSKILAEQFVAAGHQVHVITESPGDAIAGAGYQFTRRPSIVDLITLLRWSDLFFQNNISLRSLIPALLLRKPVVIAHHTWIQDTRGRVRWKDRIKYASLRSVKNIAISRAVADRLGVPAEIIGNPYDDKVFRVLPNITRDRTIVFVGRLVSDKGADLLLRALAILQRDGLTPDLTIVGSGPEKQTLRRLAAELALDRQVTFTGKLSGTALAETLNRHRILAVPSRWAEPFGLVALEGIACGCVVAGSRDGGLKEAIGPCGLTFENGNEQAVAGALKEILTLPETEAKLRARAGEHLQKFRAPVAAAAYLNVIENARS
ncbi:MAG: glycosyl transferase family 1 [Verrucomicrobia bacterium]|nr:MAG: glycosyl transferase family 1 [Verrucomicrobiota bacterium]